jgi:hypothetical protein
MGWAVVVSVYGSDEARRGEEPVATVEPEGVGTLDQLSAYLEMLRRFARDGGDLRGYFEVSLTLPPRAGRAREAQLAAVRQALVGPSSKPVRAGQSVERTNE